MHKNFIQLSLQLDRVSSIAAKYIGRPISQLPPVQPIHISSLDLSMSSFGGHGMGGPSLDLDLLPGSTSSTMPSLPYQPTGISDMDKSLMTDIAANAMEELLRLLQSNDPLWMKSSTDGRDVLNLESYERIFPRATSHLKNPNLRIEASRASGVVIMNGLALVDMIMDSVTALLLPFKYPKLYKLQFIKLEFQVTNSFKCAEQIWGAISNNCLNG